MDAGIGEEVMSAPKGIFLWIWRLDLAEKGDIAKVIAKCQEHHVSGICVKNGDRTRNGQWSKGKAAAVIKACHDAGMQIGTWNYSYQDSIKSEAAFIKECFSEGIDYHVVDGETPWEKGTLEQTNANANRFCDDLETIPDAWIAHAPIAAPYYHPTFPYEVLGTRLKATMIQAYWTELLVGKYSDLARVIDPMWVKFKKAHPNLNPVLPIGCTYGKNDLPVKAQPPGLFKQEDLTAFIKDYYQDGVSLYSYEAANPLVWDVLKSWKFPICPTAP